MSSSTVPASARHRILKTYDWSLKVRAYFTRWKVDKFVVRSHICTWYWCASLTCTRPPKSEGVRAAVEVLTLLRVSVVFLYLIEAPFCCFQSALFRLVRRFCHSLVNYEDRNRKLASGNDIRWQRRKKYVD